MPDTNLHGRVVIRSESAYKRARALLLTAVKSAAAVVYDKPGQTQEELLDAAIMQTLDQHAELVSEINWYSAAKQGNVPTTLPLSEIGKGLVALRIASGMSQQQLARRLNIPPAQICRDEKNDYKGITVERAQRVFDALGVSVEFTFKPVVEQLHAPTT